MEICKEKSQRTYSTFCLLISYTYVTLLNLTISFKGFVIFIYNLEEVTETQRGKTTVFYLNGKLDENPTSTRY